MTQIVENEERAAAGALLAPLRFHPYLREVLWGGHRLEPFKELPTSGRLIGESWEISSVPGRQSEVSEGPFKGLALGELVKRFGPRLMGHRFHASGSMEFPLLVKIIDAGSDLSLQVHPDDALACRRHGCRGKSEMWYIVDATPGARIISGLRRKMDLDSYWKALEEDNILDYVAEHHSHPGDAFFLPAGRIHAIGAGNLLVEVQATSDLTYRIYDYNRLDANGKRRELHTDLAADAIDFTMLDDYRSHPRKLSEAVTLLVECEAFRVCHVRAEGATRLALPDSFMTLTAIAGEGIVTTPGARTPLRRGESLLVPAECGEILLSGNLEVVAATI